MTRLSWVGGRARPALVPGLLFGSSMFFMKLDDNGPVSDAVVYAIVWGLLWGIWRTWEQWKQWPAGQDLSAQDRSEVVQQVLRGEAPRDRRLAPAAVELAQLQREATEVTRADRWLSVALIVGIPAWALSRTLTGHVASAVYFWVLAATLAPMVIRSMITDQRARSRANAERAEIAAQALLTASSDPSSAR